MEPKSPDKKKHSLGFRILKGIGLFLVALVLLLVIGVGLVWTYPDLILTQKRISSLSGRFIRPVTPLPPDEWPLTATFTRPDWKTRGIQLVLAPGCWEFGDQKPPSRVCSDETRIEIGIRLHRKTILQLAWVGPVVVRSSRAEIRTVSSPKKKPPPAEEKEPFNPEKYLRYVAKDFRWQTIAVEVADLKLPDMNIQGNLSLKNATVRETLDSLELRAEAKSINAEGSGWEGSLDGIARREGYLIHLPIIAGSYRFIGEKPSYIRSEISATLDLEKSSVQASFDARWRRPFEPVREFQLDAGKFQASPAGFSAIGTVKAVLEGISPLGRPPVLSVIAEAALQKKTPDRIDFKLLVDEYRFVGMQLQCDLEFSMITEKDAERILWKRGMLKLATQNFRETVKALRRTVWAIPAPFAVLKGPLSLETEPFRNEGGKLLLPARVVSNLTSREQAIDTDSKIVVQLDSRALAAEFISVDVGLKKVRLRLPDYDPIAPVPVVFRDPRIAREKESKKVAQTPSGSKVERVEKSKPPEPEKEKEKEIPLRLNISGPPGSVQLLNRYFEPEAVGEVNLKMDPTAPGEQKDALTGLIQTSRPFEIHYLNREISIDRLIIRLRPAIEIYANFSMERAGYRILANFSQIAGRSHIDLTSTPLLSEDEIVSLMLYGVPRSSATADQDSSVGSAQAAISSQAVGIFSFWALASTPVETILYDPATKTYSAVVRLPGGIVASIGNSWENDRQVALSKSLGRSWSISTELIQDVNGVNRGGTMLRWRKRY